MCWSTPFDYSHTRSGWMCTLSRCIFMADILLMHMMNMCGAVPKRFLLFAPASAINIHFICCHCCRRCCLDTLCHYKTFFKDYRKYTRIKTICEYFFLLRFFCCHSIRCRVIKILPTIHKYINSQNIYNIRFCAHWHRKSGCKHQSFVTVSSRRNGNIIRW